MTIRPRSRSTSSQRRAWCALLALVLVLGPGGCGSDRREWPDASWRPYANTSPFNVTIADPQLRRDSAAVIAATFDHGLNGCDPTKASGDERLFKCRPANLVLRQDGSGDAGWPSYWMLERDPDYTVRCTGVDGPDWLAASDFRLKIPAGALTQQGSDRHLTLLDRAGVTGRKIKNYEYDFWRATIDSQTRTLTSQSAGGPPSEASG